MADFANQTIQIASDVASKQGSGLGEAFGQGVQLAQRAEQVQQERQKLDMQKQQLADTRSEKALSLLEKIKDFKEPGSRQGYLKVIQPKLKEWGVDISPEAIGLMAKTPEMQGKVISLLTEGKTPGSNLYGKWDQIKNILNDPSAMATYKGNIPESAWGADPAKSADYNAAVDEYNKNKATATKAANTNSLGERRLAFRSDQEARAAVNKDPMLVQYQQRLEGSAKIGELISAAKSGKVISNETLLNQVSQEIVRLETGSNVVGLQQSEKGELLDYAAKLGKYRDAITGNPKSAVRPAVLEAGNQMVQELAGSYMRGTDSRMEFLKGGMTDTQKEIADAKHTALVKQYTKRLGGWHGMDEWQSPNAPSASTPAPTAGNAPPPAKTDWKTSLAAFAPKYNAEPSPELKQKFILDFTKRLHTQGIKVSPSDVEDMLKGGQ